MYYIYQITLFGKVLYIGYTNNPTVRWHFHQHYETNEILKKYFLANDIKSFKFEIIHSCLTYRQAKLLGAELIKKESETNFYLINSIIGD